MILSLTQWTFYWQSRYQIFATRVDFTIIGGGLVGLATAWKLQQKFPGASVQLLEKEAGVGQHQSTQNRGVLHAGLYYRPGSLKARLAVDGIRQMTQFCQHHHISHEICGKVVVATNATEVSRLQDLYERGQANGLIGLQRLDAPALKEIEPHAAGVSALRVPQEGIVDYAAVCAALESLIKQGGGQIRTLYPVRRLLQERSDWIIETPKGELRTRFIINCAGLHSDRVSRLAGVRSAVRIIPFRGEYYKLKTEQQHLVRHLIYPVPDPAFPFLGVHFTRLIGGGVECGPNAVLAFAREGYTKLTINPFDFIETLSFRDLWAFIARYPRTTLNEVLRSLSQTQFCTALQALVPEIQATDLGSGGAGVRAQAMHPSGELVQDFATHVTSSAIHVINAPSPAATAALAIADHIIGLLPTHHGD